MSPETCITLRIHNTDETSTSIPLLYILLSLFPPLLMLPFMLSSLWQSVWPLTSFLPCIY